MNNHQSNLFKQLMMHYITPKEMVEIRSVLHLKDKMTRRVINKTPTERKIHTLWVFLFIG